MLGGMKSGIVNQRDEERKSVSEEDEEGEEGDQLMMVKGQRTIQSNENHQEYFQPIVGVINALDQMGMKK